MMYIKHLIGINSTGKKYTVFQVAIFLYTTTWRPNLDVKLSMYKIDGRYFCK